MNMQTRERTHVWCNHVCISTLIAR